MIELNLILSGLLIGVTFIIAILAYYSFRKIEVPGARGLFYLCVVTAFYTFGYSMELASHNLATVDFWSKFQYIGLPFIPALWVYLAIGYTQKRRKNLVFYVFLFIVPVMTGVFRWVSQWIPLHYGQMSLVSNGYFEVLSFEKGPWYYFHFFYFFLCAAYTVRLYIDVYRTAKGYRRQQSALMLVASCMPIVSIVLNVTGMTALQLDSGPFFVLLNYVVLAYGIFRYRLMNIIPLSREKVFDWISDGVIVTDLEMNLLDYNPSAKRIFDSLTGEALGNNLAVILADYPEFVDAICKWKLESDDEANSVETEAFQCTISGGDGALTHFQLRLSNIYDSGYLVGNLLIINDTTQQQEMLLELEKVARTDKLTGLYNRGYFVTLFDAFFSEKRPLSENQIPLDLRIALLIFDIDHFKEVNDRFGHMAGDQVLKQLSACVQKNLRQGESVCRYGGEEFVILLSETTQRNAQLVAERLRSQIEALEIEWEGQRIPVTASFGMTVCEANGIIRNDLIEKQISFDQLLNQADKALYIAKSKGRNCIEVFREDM